MHWLIVRPSVSPWKSDVNLWDDKEIDFGSSKFIKATEASSLISGQKNYYVSNSYQLFCPDQSLFNYLRWEFIKENKKVKKEIKPADQEKKNDNAKRHK